MINLAIQGHATRGKEVIKILEMLGGVNSNDAFGDLPNNWNVGYYIFDGVISVSEVEILAKKEFKIYTLEEFLEKFPHKVGDKVKIAETGKIVSIEDMSWKNESWEVVYETCYDNDCVAFYSAIELQPYKEETMGNKPNLLQRLKEYFDNTPRDVLEKEWNELSYLNEIGPTVDEYLECVKKYRQSNQYPKTYEECCKVLGVNPSFDIRMLEDEESTLYFKFIDLVRCRNAYWKIAGEKMGLGKPWKQDYNDRCFIIANNNGNIHTYEYHGSNNVILAFPTEEMRDAFYEKFKNLIEECKELL